MFFLTQTPFCSLLDGSNGWLLPERGVGSMTCYSLASTDTESLVEPARKDQENRC